MTDRIIFEEEDFNCDLFQNGEEHLTVDLHGKTAYEGKQWILANQAIVKRVENTRNFWRVETGKNIHPMCKNLVNLLDAILGEKE